MDSKPPPLHPTEEVEETCQIPEDDDTGRLHTGGSQKDMGQDGPLAVGGTERSHLYAES